MTTPLAATFTNSVGVNVHLYDRAPSPYSNMPLVEELLSQIGITHLRDEAVYELGFGPTTYFYQNVQALVAIGYKFTLMMPGSFQKYMFTPPDQAANIQSWCNGGVEQFEGDNEPALNVPNTTRGPPLSQWEQHQLYSTLRGNPAINTIPVLGPSYIPGTSKNGTIDLRIPIPSYCSKVNFHPYPGCEHPETTSVNGGLLNNLTWARIAEGQTPPQPAQATEWGYHTSLSDPSLFLGVSDPIKARYITRGLLYPFSVGVERTFLYQLMDDISYDPANHESSFGLADFSGNPKPAFNAIKALMALCAPRAVASGPNWGFSYSGSTTNVNTVLLKRTDGSAVLFIWLGISGWNQATKTAIPPVMQASVLTITGGTPSSVVGTLFNDDGTQTITPIIGGSFIISDQLTAIEINP